MEQGDPRCPKQRGQRYRHYYQIHETISPTRMVSIGPEIDFTIPRDRDRLA